MDSGKSEDDFWNESYSSNKSNFFDEDDDFFVETDNLGSFTNESVAVIPINSIVSNDCLKIILNNTSKDIAQHVVNKTPEETIRRLFHGEHCLLNYYQTLEEKRQLLDLAIDLGDGDILTNVILFLNKSLKSSIFFTLLTNRRTALKHFINYVTQKNDLAQLEEICMATGSIYNLKDIYYGLNKNISNKQTLMRKLEQFHSHHAQNLSCYEDSVEIQENITFLDYQLKHKKVNCKSLVGQLIDLCKTELQSKKDEELHIFKKLFNIADIQYDWVVMSVLGQMKNWEKLLSAFTKTVWVTKKRSLKCAVRPDVFVLGVGQHEPPRDIIQQLLLCINDTNRSLYVAEKMQIHSYVVNYYIDQKDKTSLLKYMEKIEPGDEAMQVIQSSLNNSEIKWKNY